jgi:uncharacterized protein YaaR (DUF327 family)
MEKIDWAVNPLTYLNAETLGQHQNEKTRKKEKTRGPSFAQRLEESFLESSRALGPLREIPPSEEALQNLLDGVRSSGDDLRDRPFTAEILKYKKAVRDLVHYVVENGYDVVEKQGIKKRVKVGNQHQWRQQAYRQIEVIDRKVDELAAVCLTGQAAQIAIVARLDEIRGLLVDLTVSGKIEE